MIIGSLLLIWGIGIVILAFKLQTNIQEGADPEWRKARDLYSEAPILFCSCMFVALSLWPGILSYLLYKTFVKGKSHGN